MASLEFAVRDWLRGQPLLASFLDSDPKRIDLEWKGVLTAKHVTLYQSGGSEDPNRYMQQGAFTFHCWGQSRAQAAEVADRLCATLRAMTHEPLNADVTGRDATIVSPPTWLPGADGNSRYVVTALVSAAIATPVA